MQQSVKQQLRHAKIPGAAVAVVNGNATILETFGTRRAGSTQPVDVETAFDIGSCSKSFVSAAIGSLVTSGDIAFDEPVRRIVPELELDSPELSEDLTVRDLLSNRIGLKRQLPVESFANPDIDTVDILRRVRHLERIRRFREGYVYFNPGFMAARIIVERISGIPYEEFVAQRLFAPLGMTNSATGQRVQQLSNHATGHTVHDENVEAIDNAPRFDNWQGAAGVYCSIADAAAWLRFHIDGTAESGTPPLSPAVLDELHSAHTPMPANERKLIHCPPGSAECNYCMGWWETSLAGHRLVQHAGEMFGWRAQFAFIPERKIGVAVLLSAAVNLHAAIAYWMLQHEESGQSQDWWAIAAEFEQLDRHKVARLLRDAFPCTVGKPPTLELPEYTGDYRHPASGVARVSLVSGELQIQLVDGRVWDCRLVHLGEDVFEAELLSPWVKDYMPVPARVRFHVECGKAVAVQDVNATFERSR